LQAGDLICLEGDLGSGKTCLAQGIGRGWGVAERLISPTFTLVHEYQRPRDGLYFYHVDLYRVARPEEVYSLGLDDYLDDSEAVTIIEWAEQAGDLLPSERLWVTLRHIDNTRRGLLFSAQGARYESLLGIFRKRAFGA
jgi:tRNA threonylcarbamoyladenosine biosynthesis protein TsaE